MLCGVPLSSGEDGAAPSTRRTSLVGRALSGRLAFASTGVGPSGSSRMPLIPKHHVKCVMCGRDHLPSRVAVAGALRPLAHEASTSAPNSARLFSPRASCRELVQRPMPAEVRVIGGQAKNRANRGPLGFLQEHPIDPCDDAALLDPPLGGRPNGGRAASVHPADGSTCEGIRAAGETAVPPRRAAPSRPNACHQRPQVGTVARGRLSRGDCMG